MDAINSDTIRCYYELFKDVLKNNQLIESPVQIYNVDETGMPLNPLAGQKNVKYCTSGNRSLITAIVCVGTTGQAIPPFDVFDAKSLNEKFLEHMH